MLSTVRCLVLLFLGGGIAYSGILLGNWVAFDYSLSGLNLSQVAWELLGAQFAILLYNGIVGSSILRKIGGFHRRGSKIQSVTGRKNRRASYLGLAASILAVYCSKQHFFVTAEMASKFFTMLRSEYLFYLTTILNINTAFFFGICGYLVGSIVSNLIGIRLPLGVWIQLKRKNSIVLGTINEEDPEKSTKWARISEGGLRGNILITGSIGSGKTQGTILPYFKQAITNFSKKTPFLLIDPKGTFIKKAINIALMNNRYNDIFHIKLNGVHKINPVYRKDALKNSEFSKIAEMIRAAQINFLGKSNETPFWEFQANSLVRNAVVYASATKGYYTLNDIYLVLMGLRDNSIEDELENALYSKEWDQEESHNIKVAIHYFRNAYRQLDEKVRSGITATATTFLTQFTEYQATKIFCPPEDSNNTLSIDELVTEGKIIMFDIENPALARSLGTLIKICYQQAVLDIINSGNTAEEHIFTFIDEYQDVVTSGFGGALGDDRFLAKARESKSITVVGTQGLVSLENSIGKSEATYELIQNFRTRIACHSSDKKTISNIQELMGKEEKEQVSQSYGEMANDPKKSLVLGGYDTTKANINESFVRSSYRDFTAPTSEFARLQTMEAYAQIFDGVSTRFEKLYLKPHFIKWKALSHKNILRILGKKTSLIGKILAILLGLTQTANATPDICSVVSTKDFSTCLDMRVTPTMCGSYPPRPCLQFDYYVPQTFIEVTTTPKVSYFSALPVASSQLASAGKQTSTWGAAEGDHETTSYLARTITIPYSYLAFEEMPCGGARMERLCFDGMSEHLGSHWATGHADKLQPKFLAWAAAPKMCLLKGAISSVGFQDGGAPSGGSPMCSFNIPELPTTIPSTHSVCNGWGVFYPRSGTYHGPASLTGSLMIASRIKSLSSEVFNSTPNSLDEKWQMISPQSSSCFREGQNIAYLENIKNVRDLGKLMGKGRKGRLFSIWKKVSCKKDLYWGATTTAILAAMKGMCAPKSTGKDL